MTLAEMNFLPPDLKLASAELFILAMACVTLISDLFVKDRKRTPTFVLTVLALLGAALLEWCGKSICNSLMRLVALNA